MTSAYAPNRAAFYAHNVELPVRGELSFEVWLDETSVSRSERGLAVKLGNLLLMFAGNSCLRHQPGFNPEWRHVAMGRIKAGTWIPVRVTWDGPSKKVKYYFGEGRVASGVDTGMTIGKSTDDVTMRLKIGHTGLIPGVHVNQIRNISVRSWEAAATAASRNLALVFRGLTDRSKIRPEWLADYPKDRQVTFTLGFIGSTYLVKNRYVLDPFPDSDLMDEASLIVLADIPLTNDPLPYETQEKVLQAVREGATLIVTDGIFALEKCGDYASPIAQALPIRLVSPWEKVEGANRVEAEYGKGKIVVVKGADKK